jgi:hypothetical protein
MIQEMKMKTITYSILLLLLSTHVAYPQLRDYRIHSRGMLRQTVYNTGELGRAFDNGANTIVQGFPSMEWPPNSYQIIDRTVYSGQHNSFGGGLWVAGTRGSIRRYEYCGAVTDNNGNPTTIENIYSYPLSIERTENFPLLPDGNLNFSYNPNEAEEIITAKWNTPDSFGVRITRTSRAWSYPEYNSFIIYEYELENITPDTLYDVFVAFPYGFMTSMFGYQRKYNRWSEADSRVTDQYARYDFRRYMTYNHDRIGKPDSVFFNEWSTPGNRGGLNSPQAAGLLTLYYDYEHLATRGQTQLVVTGADTMSWDENRKIKQPFLNRYENGNLYPSKQQLWLDPRQGRKTRPFRITSDSLFLKAVYGEDPTQWKNGYWLGRCRPSADLGNSQPASHGYGFGPYTIPPHQKINFSVAEVVGYGAGVASDSVYKDLGGGIRYVDADPFLNPVPSWYKTITYPGIGTIGMGSNYLQTHPLPWYVTPGVVSIRDVADRAIQMYTGRELVKYDTSQFEPRTTPISGLYSPVSIPIPAPVIRVENTSAAVNKIVWGPQVESFSTPRLNALFSHYQVLRAASLLGPWTIVDSVGKRDPRYFRDSVYIVYDVESNLGEVYNYMVISVDSLGGKSGMTNITQHETSAPAAQTLGKVYVVPNPLIVTNNLGGDDPNGEVTDRIQFMGLTKRCTIRIFSYSGQLINTIEHEADKFNNPWYQITRNNQILASGVYFFVAEDLDTGTRSHGKFVIIH